MIYGFKQRVSDNPLIDKIWQATISGEGIMYLQAKYSTDIIFARSASGISPILAGTAAQATRARYKESMEYIGISFKPGVYIPKATGGMLINSNQLLPQTSATTFQIAGTRMEIPTYENIEAFASSLKNNGVIAVDTIVANTLEGIPVALSTRSIQRHFLRTTGLTYNFTHQIQRAQYAELLLQQGRSLTETTYEAGYSDQAHMSNSFRRILGKSPSEI